MATKRRYHLKRRAERQEETHQRILDATVALHQRSGAPGVTISAVAEQAGVERLTVYRHFPDEAALLTAATSYYLDANPPPDPEPWRAITDPEVRLRVGVTAAYTYHQQTEAMIGSLIQGMPFKPVICDALESYAVHWRRVHHILAEGWDAPDPALLTAAVGHAISFKTWHSLIRDLHLSNAQAVELMIGAVRSTLQSAATGKVA
jgi:AcrR family transcriptional regulator